MTKVYVVRTWVDPFSGNECPVLVFNEKPTAYQVFDAIIKSGLFHPDEDELHPDLWEWGYEVELKTVIELNKEE